jgi:hypothetical protein
MNVRDAMERVVEEDMSGATLRDAAAVLSISISCYT